MVKKMFKIFKKAIKWYLYKTAEAYGFTPTGMIPMIKK